MQAFVKAALAGNTAAWHTLYRQHYPWLYAKALRIWGNTPAAKDAVQDAFVQAFLKLDQLRDPAAFPGWLQTILIRSSYQAKQSLRLNACSNPVPLKNETYWEDAINNKYELLARKAKLYNTLFSLPKTLQGVLLLRYFSSWNSYEQMATVFSVPVGTIRSRLSQARQKLKEHWLKDDLENEGAFREAAAWNHFYSDCFGSVHDSGNSRERLIRHFDKNLQLVFTSGKTAYGRNLVAKEIEDDVVHGSVFADVHVMSSGPLSVVEVRNRNSKEYPNRCPDSGLFVLYRSQNKVNRLQFHNSK